MEVELVEVKTQGTKELNDVGNALKKVQESVAQALKDGWQPGEDLPIIIMQAIPALGTAIDGLGKAGAEVQAYPVAAILGTLVPVAEGVQSLLDLKGENESA